MIAANPLSLPLTPPAGYVYQWTTASVMGVEDVDTIKRALESGWGRVPSGEQPDLPSKDGFVEYGGLWLMTRPVEMKLAADARDLRAAEEAVEKAPAKRLGHKHDFKLHDPIWDRRTGKFLGYVVQPLTYSFEWRHTTQAPVSLPYVSTYDADGNPIHRQQTMTEWLLWSGGEIYSSNEAERAWRGGFPFMDDMVHTEEEAVAYMNNRAKNVADALIASGYDVPDMSP